MTADRIESEIVDVRRTRHEQDTVGVLRVPTVPCTFTGQQLAA